MEHCFLRIFLIIASVFLLNACEKPLAEPETADPIYLDIRSDADAAEKGIESKKKEVEGFEKQLEKPDSEANPLERKHTQLQLFTAKKTIALMEQDLAYFKLRADTRKALDRDKYPEIFKNKGKWPDMNEVEQYKAAKRLRGASRNWNDRVPRPANAPTKDNPFGEKKAEGNAEGKSEAKPEGAEPKKE